MIKLEKFDGFEELNEQLIRTVAGGHTDYDSSKDPKRPLDSKSQDSYKDTDKPKD